VIQEEGAITLIQGVLFDLAIGLPATIDLAECEGQGYIAKSATSPERWEFDFRVVSGQIRAFVDGDVTATIPIGEYLYEIEITRADVAEYRRSGTATILPGSPPPDPTPGGNWQIDLALLTEQVTLIAHLLASRPCQIALSGGGKPVVLTGGVVVLDQGLWRTKFRFSSGFGNHRFTLGRTKELATGEVTGDPKIQFVGTDEVELTFWGAAAIGDGTLETYLVR
jgi:hypothetical protein